MLIEPVSFRQLLDDPGWKALEDEYAAECSLSELGKTDPQRDMYAAMEASGGLQCFGMYEAAQLVGFVSLIVYVLPHYGKKIATTESIFIARKHRTGRAGMNLLKFVESYAKERGCRAVLYTAPIDSRFEHLLAMRKEYRPSNSVFIRSLA